MAANLSPPADPVLVVEDHDETREMVETFLKFKGYTVETARNGEEALEWLLTHHPCLIVLDLSMPVMDGWAFRRAQLKLPDSANVPVLLMTAHDTDPRTGRLKVAGAVRKPIDFDALVDAVAGACTR